MYFMTSRCLESLYRFPVYSQIVLFGKRSLNSLHSSVTSFMLPLNNGSPPEIVRPSISSVMQSNKNSLVLLVNGLPAFGFHDVSTYPDFRECQEVKR